MDSSVALLSISDKGNVDDPVELGSVAWSESEMPAAEGREKLSLNGSSEGEEEEGRREGEGGRREDEREGGGREEEREGGRREGGGRKRGREEGGWRRERDSLQGWLCSLKDEST